MKVVYLLIALVVGCNTISYAQKIPISGTENNSGYKTINNEQVYYNVYESPYVIYVVKFNSRGFVDAQGDYIFNPVGGDYTSENTESMYLNYTFFFTKNKKWGAIDLLGNEIIPFKYKNSDKALKSKEWKERAGFIENIELSGKYQEKIDDLDFKRMIVYLAKYRNTSFSSEIKFTRGNTNLKKVIKQNLHGVIDSWENYLLPIVFTELITDIDGEPSSKIIPSKTNTSQKYYDFIDYSGECVISADAYQVKTIEKSIYAKDEKKYYLYYNKDGKYCYMSTNKSGAIDLKSFITRYVTLNMTHWNEKNEFESPEAFTLRIEDKFQHKAKEYYTRCAFFTYIWLFPEAKPFYLCDYDATNHSFLVKSDVGEIAINIPTEVSPLFRKQWELGEVTVGDLHFISDTNGIRLSNIEFLIKNPNEEGMRSFKGNQSTAYYAYNVNQQEQKIHIQIHVNPNNESKEKENEIYLVQSDVDRNIPHTSISNNETFAVIIANEIYQNAPKVSFALRDGDIFSSYCQKTLGIPEKNISIYKNATSGIVIDAIEKIKRIAAAYDGNAKFIFYYSGHGVPDKSKNTYLMPVDASIHTIDRTGFSLQQLYDELGSCNTPLATLFIDACFSGATREGTAITEDRGVIIDVKDNCLQKGNIIVFSASENNQTAVPYNEKSHGVFTYFLLKKMQETNGDTSLLELFEYIKQQVRQTVAIEKIQIPGIAYSPAMFGKWENMTLK